MAERLASHQVKAGKFSYFFDLNRSEKGHLFLTINQSEFRGEGEPREYQKLVIFPDNVKEFYEALCESIRDLRDQQKKGERQPAAVAAPKVQPLDEYDPFADED